MNLDVRVGLGWLAVGLVLGCGSPSHHISGGDGAPIPDAPLGPDAPPVIIDAMPHPDAAMDSLGPSGVMITVPAAANTLITSGTVDVTCVALPNTMTHKAVETVHFDLTDQAGTRVTAIGASSGTNEWTGTANISALVNGPLEVSCTATDVDMHSNSDTQADRLDLGPLIIVSSPTTTTAVKGQVNIDFSVLPAPIDMTDTMAGVTQASIHATIRGVDVTAQLTGVSDGMGGFQYTGLVLTNDPTLFTPALNGDNELQITAQNARMVTRTFREIFSVDNDPPTIVITAPAAGEIVGGIITVSATITDAHGVDPTNVKAVFGNGPVDIAEFSLAHFMGDTYMGTYDARDLRHQVEMVGGTCPTDCMISAACPAAGHACLQLVYPTLSVRARDIAGNQGAQSEIVGMDYTPPTSSLDPPVLREGKFDATTGTITCSLEFDPLGLDAVDDRQSVAQLSEFRARIEDEGNLASNPSHVAIPIAGTNDASVQMFILDSTVQAGPTGDALIVDTDGDGLCDDINPNAVHPITPMPAIDAFAVNLAPADPGGDSYFTDDPAGYAGYPICNSPGTSPTPPPPKCTTSGLQRIIKTEIGMGHVIYSIAPIDMVSCVGHAFDAVANNIHDGWACVAIRAVDNLGNVGVSRPLKVCFNHDGSASMCPPLPSNYPPVDVPGGNPTIPLGTPPASMDCTGVYDSMTGVTNSAASCIPPLDFPLGDVRRNDL